MHPREHFLTRLSSELQLIVLAGSSPSARTDDRLRDLVRDPLDWNALLMKSLWHKTAFVVLETLLGSGHVDHALAEGSLPLLVLNHWKQLRAVNGHRNAMLLALSRQLCEAADRAGLPLAVSKGGVILIGRCYTASARKMYDVDFLASRADLGRIVELFGDQGFVLADYDHRLRRARPLPRERVRAWLLHGRGLPNFVRPTDDPFMEYALAQVQFTLGSTQTGRTTGAEPVLADSVTEGGIRRVDDDDLFVQLCLHVARERSEDAFREWQMDVNLIKLMDLGRLIEERSSAPVTFPAPPASPARPAWHTSALERADALGFLPECHLAIAALRQVWRSEAIDRLARAAGLDARTDAEPDDAAAVDAVDALGSLAAERDGRARDKIGWERIVGAKSV